MIEPNGKVIGQASDIWMLGCIAYLMVFRKHPFLGEGKLAILTGISEYPSEGKMTDLVKSMLSVGTEERPSALSLIEIIDRMRK